MIVATVLASMAGFLDASVVNVAVPAIATDLGTSLAGLCVAAAVISALFVRAGHEAPAVFSTPAPIHGCPLPDTGGGYAPVLTTTTARSSEAL